MTSRSYIGWVTLGAGGFASAIALAAGLAAWNRASLDDHGRALVAEGNHPAAIRVLSRVVAAAPGDADAHYYLGLAYAGIGLCGAASLHFDESARLAPAYRRLRARLPPSCDGIDAEPSSKLVRSRGPE